VHHGEIDARDDDVTGRDGAIGVSAENLFGERMGQRILRMARAGFARRANADDRLF
jgi:hypothetical protein